MVVTSEALSPIPREIFHVLYNTVCLHLSQKAHMACNSNYLVEMKDFSRPQAVTCTVNVIIFSNSVR